MESSLKTYLLKFKLTEDEINTMEQIAPMLEVVSLSDFKENVKVLVDYGYPFEDMQFLFLANPNLFVISSERLGKELLKLKVKYKDVEEILKENPYII